MKQLVVHILFHEDTTGSAATGPDVARLLREAGEQVQRAWPGALPGDDKGTTVMALRDAQGRLFGTATFGEANTKEAKP